MAPHLPIELLLEALATTHEISDGYYRVKAQSRLAVQLPPQLGAQVLTAALA